MTRDGWTAVARAALLDKAPIAWNEASSKARETHLENLTPAYAAQPPFAAAAPQPFEPSKATLALVLSIVSWFACGIFLSIPAVIIARGETRAINEGRRDPSNAGKATAAFWVGLANIAIQVIALLLAALMFAGVFGVAMLGHDMREVFLQPTGSLSSPGLGTGFGTGDGKKTGKALLRNRTLKDFSKSTLQRPADEDDTADDTIDDTIDDTTYDTPEGSDDDG